MAGSRLAGDSDGVGPTGLASRFNVTLAVARSSLVRWEHTVRMVLRMSGSEEARNVMHGLASWYERMCIDAEYSNPPPEDGVDAMMALGPMPADSPRDPLMVTFRAVQVARELATCRAYWSKGDRESEFYRHALDRLDLALANASGQHDSSPSSDEL